MGITIDEGIRTLGALKKGRFEGTREQAKEAEGLGTEALKQLKRMRAGKLVFFNDPLPGEAKT